MKVCKSLPELTSLFESTFITGKFDNCADFKKVFLLVKSSFLNNNQKN